MWKWLAIAAAAYGLLGLAAVLVAPLHPPVEEALGWQEMLRGIEQVPGHGMQPGSGPLPDKPGMPYWEKPPRVIDFDSPKPVFATRPQQQAEVVRNADGNSFLRWRPAPKPERFATLILPWRPPNRDADKLELRWRADRPAPVIIGLRESNGSVYTVKRIALREWSELTVSLRELRRDSRLAHEDSRINLDQVHELVFVCFARREPWASDAASPNAIELDDIRLR